MHGAINFIAQQNLLSKLTIEFMQKTAGGFFKVGWIRRERRNTGGWKRQYFVLWPKEPHPAIGRLLVYYNDDNPGSRPKGVVQILTPVIRAPKTPRPDYFCIRLNSTRLYELQPLKATPKKLILGFESETEIRDWIEALRIVSISTPKSSGLKPEVLQNPSCCGWLLKRSDGAITWWKKRWFELQGTQLIYWDSSKEQREGSFNVENYELFFPVWPEAHREYEIILVATGYADDQRKRHSQYLCADDEPTFNAWKEAFKAKMRMGNDTQNQGRMLASVNYKRTKSRLEIVSPRIGNIDEGSLVTPKVDRKLCPEDFDVQNVIGKGGFGKVLLVTRRSPGQGAALLKTRSGTPKQLLAMKIMSKEYLIMQDQVQHIQNECQILQKLDHPFIVSLRYAFANKSSLFLVLGFERGGDLYHHMQTQHRFNDDQTCFIASEIVLAIGHLHQQDIAFRDLKAENVLLDEHGHIRLTGNVSLSFPSLTGKKTS
eukprot:SAG31_NODE_267_length_18790_cov_3.661655_7_plen_486_part_00